MKSGSKAFNWLSSKKNSWGKNMHDSCWGKYEWFEAFQVSIRNSDTMMENYSDQMHCFWKI